MATSKPYRSMPSSNISKFGTENSGLLTTVAELPYNFKLQYVSVEAPLDLSVKTPFNLGQITPPHSPQRSPLKKRPYHHIIETISATTSATTTNTTSIDEIDTKNELLKIDPNTDTTLPPAKLSKKEVTPNGKQIKVTSMPKTHKSANNKVVNVNTSTATLRAAQPNASSTAQPSSSASSSSIVSKEHKRVKAVRKLKFDEKKSSPVSGTIIRALDEIDGDIPQESGDIDPQYNIVEVTEEAKAEIAAIPNVIGAYLCKLCQIEFDDAFCLARHRCSCIVLLEYRCPECGKRFNCPANLASHRRWHKPKDEVMKKSNGDSNGSGENDENTVQYPCNLCGKFFKRQAYLRKHLVTHNKPNSKTNKRAIASANEQNDGTSNSTTSSNHSTNITLTTQQVTNARIDSLNLSQHATNNGRSKSVCSDDSVASSLDSNVSSVQYTEINDDDCQQSPTPPPPPPFRLFKSNIFTEEENIAAAALAHLRHSKDSVIRHTTALTT